MGSPRSRPTWSRRSRRRSRTSRRTRRARSAGASPRRRGSPEPGEEEPERQLEPPLAEVLLAERHPRQEAAELRVCRGGADDRVRQPGPREEPALDPERVGELAPDLAAPARLVAGEPGRRAVPRGDRLRRRHARVLARDHRVVDALAGIAVDEAAGVTRDEDAVGDRARERPAERQPVRLEVRRVRASVDDAARAGLLEKAGVVRVGHAAQLAFEEREQEAHPRVDAVALGEHVAVTRVALVAVGDVHRLGIRGGEVGLLHRVERERLVGEAPAQSRRAGDDAVDAVGRDDELRRERAAIHRPDGDAAGRAEDLGDARALAHLGAGGARALEQRRVEFGPAERQVEGRPAVRQHGGARRALHQDPADLVDRDRRAQIVREVGEAPVHPVTNAAAAGLVAGEALRVEHERPHAAPRERERRERPRRSPTDDDDVGHGASPSRLMDGHYRIVGMPEFLPFVRRWFERTFSAPTRAQRDGWSAIASGRDTLVIAPTGSGKTLAAFLWALDRLHRLGLEGRLEDRVYVVYVSPLRALNNDIEKNLRAPLAGIRAAAGAQGLELPEVRVAVRTGDTLAAQRQAMTRRPPHILITTPASLYILLTAAGFRPALSRARFVIVDEVHALLGGKRGAHLALSLERLQALVQEAGEPRPQRIGCSATVRPVEEALAFVTGATAREPVIVDAGFSRNLDVAVVSPVDDFLTTTSDTVWDATLQQVAELVQAHRTTLVFAQSRRSAERLARDLNDRIVDGRVAAHHGSLSRRARLEAENRLKDGQLKALVATSSLELGIDVGAIDLVVQLQSPRNVAAALQRVGRAGHALSRVSKGRLVVTKGEELVEAAAVVRSIHERTLDRMTMPNAPLDVLAQQIIAAVAAESIDTDALWNRFIQAAPYRALTRETFREVVRSVAEPLPHEVKGVAPRVLWDRVNDRLHARRGTRFLALTSGGTIQDAGLYDVYVAETDLKVGTLDEEFVTESLPGDVFLLGSNAWKIQKVRADRVLVEDAHGMSPTIPFWKGEHPSRSFDLGLAVGRLRRDAAGRVDDPDFTDWAQRECGLEPRAAAALRAWLVKAGEVLDGVPDDQGIVVEYFADEMGGRHAMIHSVFGMRINGAWGMALKEKVRRAYGLVAEAAHVDDGLLLSFAPGQIPPTSPERLATLVTPEEVDDLLGRALIGSPLFGTRFRHAAVRSLFIPRTYKGQRTPAYLMRLKADALLEAVGGLPDFPVVAETLPA